MFWDNVGLAFLICFQIWAVIGGITFIAYQTNSPTTTNGQDFIYAFFWPIWLIRALKRGFLEEWKK